MKLWLISQSVNDGYDTYDSAVVAAQTKDAARHTKVGNASRDEEGFALTWAAPEHVSVELIGEAVDGTEAGVVLASFNAG